MGAVKRKTVHAELAALRAEDTKPLTWIPVPDWGVIEEPRVTFLWCDSQRERMSTVTKAEYVKALAQHLPEVIEAGQAESSWQAFRARVADADGFTWIAGTVTNRR